jgi:hypothetical protein
MALPNGVTQRREMEFSASIDLGSRRNQHLYGFDISPYCGDVKRPIVVVSDLVHTDGPVFEHERVEMASSNCSRLVHLRGGAHSSAIQLFRSFPTVITRQAG